MTSLAGTGSGALRRGGTGNRTGEKAISFLRDASLDRARGDEQERIRRYR
jgi:hypothetical protein